MINNKTKKRKGDAFEKFIVQEVRKLLDPKARQTRASGAGLDKGDIYCPDAGWNIEAKNHKHLVITDWIQQLKIQADGVNRDILVFKHAKSADINPEPYAVLSLYDLIGIKKEGASVVVEEAKDSNELKFALEGLIFAIKKVMKLLNN